MAEKKIGVKEWLAKNQKDMICCPNQPGNLMISKSACSKRFLASRNEDFQDLMRKDFFNFAYKTGLTLCQKCPIGKELTGTREKKSVCQESAKKTSTPAPTRRTFSKSAAN